MQHIDFKDLVILQETNLKIKLEELDKRTEKLLEKAQGNSPLPPTLGIKYANELGEIVVQRNQLLKKEYDERMALRDFLIETAFADLQRIIDTSSTYLEKFKQDTEKLKGLV